MGFPKIKKWLNNSKALFLDEDDKPTVSVSGMSKITNPEGEEIDVRHIFGVINDAGEFRAVRLDANTNSLQTIMYEHHEIHNGSHFFIQNVVQLAINEVYDIQFTTPDTDEHIHLTYILDCENEIAWSAYEGVTINTAGTPIPPVNNNRNSSNASVALVAGVQNVDLTAANADTDISAATKLGEGITGAKKTAGTDARSSEIILKRNTKYTLRAKANVAGYVDFQMKWYEQTP